MIPIIKIEVGAMKESIMHAFSQRQIDISQEVQRALDKQCTPEAIQAHVNKAAGEAVSEAVSSAVKMWWATSDEGRALIEAAIVERMNEEAELYSKKLKK
jgi:hypothetical protein